MSNNETLRKKIDEAKARLERLKKAQIKEAGAPSLGIAMLIESDLDKASVLLSAESIADSFQDMAEKIARVEANDLIPMDKALKVQFGEESANRFYQSVQTVLRALLDQLKQAQDTVNKEVDSLRSGTPPNDMANAADVAPEEPAADPAADMAMEPEMDAEAMPDDAAMGGDEAVPADDMGDEPAIEPEPALGRGRKMSESLSDDKLLKAFVVEMRKSGNANGAAKIVAERYGIDVSDVKAIVKESAKG